MGASATPDGRYIYASARTGAAGYNQMMGTTQVVMYDRATGRLERRTLNLGTGFRPQVSPDGKTVAYGSRRMAVTGLKLRDLASGDKRGSRTTSSATTSNRADRATSCPATPGCRTRSRWCSRIMATSGAWTQRRASSRRSRSRPKWTRCLASCRASNTR
jgi:hypothetical protein